MIKLAGPWKDSYLHALKKVKILDRESGFSQVQILDRIELSNILIDELPKLQDDLVNSLYFTCFLKNMSLSFFKIEQLMKILSALSVLRPKERDFWLRAEDYVLRVK